MNVQVFCPNCDRSCRIKEDLVGRRVRCPGCQSVFKAEEVPLAEPDDEPAELPEITFEGGRSVPNHAAPTTGEPNSSEPKRARKERNSGKATPVTPGAIQNPFDEGSKLAGPAPVDASPFEFEAEAAGPEEEQPEPAPRHRDHGRTGAQRSQSREKTREKKAKPAPPETDFAWNTEGDPPDALTSKSEINLPQDDKRERAAPRAKKRGRSQRPGQTRREATGPQQDSSPFDFGDAEPPAPLVEPLDEQGADASDDNGADGLGFQDLDQPAAVPAASLKPKKKSRRKFFHVRQSGFWSEVRLYRVFIHEEELVFILAACGKEAAAMEEAITSDEPDKCEKKIRSKLHDLDQTPVEELAESFRGTLRFPAGKITAAAIDAASLSLLRKRGSAILRLEHKSKGLMTFDLLEDEDVERALALLPGLLEDVLAIHVRWDRSRECYVART
jgi:hypothetical protein